VADKPGRRASYRVQFDDTPFAEDLAHTSSAGQKAAEQKRAAVERAGQPRDELLGCSTEGRDGTSLPGCVKTYVPWPTGRWGMVFEFRFDEDHRPYLAFLAFGVRHHPLGSNARTVYEVAHHRIHVQPPRR
jgi:hypothetical protein